MDAINRRTLVTFQARTSEKSTFGHVTKSWTDIKTMYCKVDYEQADESGTERDIIQGKVTITCRPVPTLTTGHRAFIDGKPYDIRNIRFKSRTWYEIEATEIVD